VGGLLGTALSRVQTVHDSHLPLYLVFFRYEQKKQVWLCLTKIGLIISSDMAAKIDEFVRGN